MKIKFDLTFHTKLPVVSRHVKAADIKGNADIEVTKNMDKWPVIGDIIRSKINTFIKSLGEEGLRGTVTIDNEVIEITNPNSNPEEVIS